eukprot:904139_1
MPSSCPLYTRKGKQASYGIDAWYRIQLQAHIETHPTISPKECYEWFESTEYYSYSYFEKNFAKIKRGIQPERALKVQNGRKSTTSYEGNKDLAKSIGTEIFTKYKTLDDVLHFLNI